MTAPALKDIRRQGDSRKRAHRFPKGARLKLGKELTRVQLGLQPRKGEWLTEIGLGAQEIRIADNKEAYRVIYVATFAGCVYVLHAFHKKSKKGIATSPEDLGLASKRYKELVKSLGMSC